MAISISKKNRAASTIETKNPPTAPAIEIGAVGTSAMMLPNIGAAFVIQPSPASAPAAVAITTKSYARICATKMTARRTADMPAPSLF